MGIVIVFLFDDYRFPTVDSCLGKVRSSSLVAVAVAVASSSIRIGPSSLSVRSCVVLRSFA
jgi:hypothetical protein